VRLKLFEVAEMSESLLEFQVQMIPPEAPIELIDLRELRLEGRKDKI